MFVFRALLLFIVGTMLVYTGIVGTTQGWNFMPVFFGDLVALGWRGQFNLDFACFLLLAALWLAWRHGFSAPGIVVALLVPLLGAPLFCGYLLVVSLQTRGDVRQLLLGPTRAAG